MAGTPLLYELNVPGSIRFVFVAGVPNHWSRHVALDAGGTFVVDVRAFGAKGDGVADDTNALNAAIAAAALDVRGGEVRIPPGEYRVTDTIFIPRNLYKGFKIRGSGSQTTLIRGPSLPSDRPVAFDFKTASDGAMTLGNAALTSASGRFVKADEGKDISVAGARSGGSTLITTILTWNSATSVDAYLGKNRRAETAPGQTRRGRLQ